MRAMRYGLMLLLLACCSRSLFAQSFTYQGFLKENGVPANGTFDFRFRLWTSVSGGTQVETDLFVNNLRVQNGLFTTELNFGSVWDGSDRYLEIGVRPGSSTGDYQGLSPRVRIARAPYAARADAAPPVGLAGGDLSGNYPNPTVAKIQGRAVASTAPSAGQVLKWNGSAWSPAADLRDQFWQASGSNILYNAGNVGIGTSNPLSSLHVETATGDTAIFGIATATSGLTYGMYGAGAYGMYGKSDRAYGKGVYGEATAVTSLSTYGVHGKSAGYNGYGVYGEATAASGATYGVYGKSDSSTGTGVYGTATATSGNTIGGHFVSQSTAGIGVHGAANATSGITYGGWFGNLSTEGAGVYGYAFATSGTTAGGWFASDSTSGRGAVGHAPATSGNTYGVYGRSDSTSGRGVVGLATASSGVTYGVYGQSNSNLGYGVYSWGRFAATGTKSFQIDHPLSPENAYLNHYSAEGPEPYNIYRGTVVLDVKGEAWGRLPDYFEAINRDPSYHLTPIGAPMPNLHVAVEVQGNRFKIAGGVPGKKVSWEVKATRNDRWVQEYGYQTEQPKPAEYRGKYLHPELYGQPKELGIHYRPEPEREVTPPAPEKR